MHTLPLPLPEHNRLPPRGSRRLGPYASAALTVLVSWAVFAASWTALLDAITSEPFRLLFALAVGLTAAGLAVTVGGGVTLWRRGNRFLAIAVVCLSLVPHVAVALFIALIAYVLSGEGA